MNLDWHESTTTLPKSMLYIWNRLTPLLSHGTILFPLSPYFFPVPQKRNVGLMPSVHHRRKDSPSQDLIEKNCLFCRLSLALLLFAGLAQSIRSISLQHRSSKWSRTTHANRTKARKPRSFIKLIPIRTVHNRMDKLTLTRQFWIQFVIWFGGMIYWDIKKKLACNNID